MVANPLILIEVVIVLVRFRNNLNFVTEELKNPQVNLPRAIFFAIPLVTTCYVALNISYLTVLSANEIVASNAVAVVSSFQKKIIK